MVADQQEALTEGLRLLRGREQLRRDVNLGMEQLDRGEGRDGDEVFARLEAQVNRLERGEGDQ